MSWISLAALLSLGQNSGADGLSLADLPAYAAGLIGNGDTPPIQVSFRQLWAEPAAYQGRSVSIAGKVARVFRAPATGALPPRVELWLSQGQDLICAVLPDSATIEEVAREGKHLSLSGTSLGIVRYTSGDVVRLAPLVVGPGPARPIHGDKAVPDSPDWAGPAWILAAIGAATFAGFLVRAHAKRPPRPRREMNDDVEFLS